MNKNIAVIGAGITGVLSAYFLTKAGYKVTVLEQERYPAMRTSFANGGQVSVSNSEVWNTWSNIQKGISWMFKKDAPLLIGHSLSWAKINWLLKFVYYTAKNEYAINTAKTIELGLKSRILYKNILDEEDIAFDQSFCGILHFYKDIEYFKNAQICEELYTANGCEWQILNPIQTLSKDPALKYIENIKGGAWTSEDWTGDIHKFCHQLVDILEKKYKVEFKFNNQIKSINDLEILKNNFDFIVVSAGIGSIAISKLLGDNLSMYPVKGYSITITVSPEDMQYVPKISLLDDQAKIVTSTLGNRFRVAGTAELSGENYDIKRSRIEPLLKWVNINFPKINTSNYTSWACLRPMTPNMLPIIKQSNKNKKVFYHTGHGHLGWTFSPATSVLLTELIEKC